MSPSRKQRSCAITACLATAVALGAAPGAFAATTVTYNAGGTSPGMNVVDDPGNAAVRLPRALRRAAARRDRVPARVVSIETGSHGPKMTIRPMLLR